MPAPDSGIEMAPMGRSGRGGDILLVSAYTYQGDDQEHRVRFEDQHGLAEINVGGTALNVYDTHAETMWWATAVAADPSTYPSDAGPDKKPKLVRGSVHLVPPCPRAAGGKICAHQGPVYRILEEHKIGDEPQGYISTGTLEALDYLEGLPDDVTPGKKRASGGAASHAGQLHGMLFQNGLRQSGDREMDCVMANGAILHVMNRRGVAQSLATKYIGKSKRGENQKKWAEADLRGDFSDGSYRFDFDTEGGWHVAGFEELHINSIADLGMELNGNSVVRVKPSSPAASAGITDDLPWRFLDPGESGLCQHITFNGISYGQSGAEQQVSFSAAQLENILRDVKPATITLHRAPLADKDLVWRKIDEAALRARDKAVRALQEKAQAEGWFVRQERLSEKNFPPGDDGERWGCGPFPADWPGYYMEDENGHPVKWDPAIHAEPVDEDFYAREFCKTYCYVNARGSEKGPSGPSGDKWMGLAGLYAALYGYETQGKKAGEDPADLFPDRNMDTRRMYTGGIQTQIPREWTDSYAGGDEDKAFKGKLLRWAYFQGFNNGNRKADDMVPDSVALRQAYKKGKEAVCIGITQQVWQRELGNGDEAHKRTFKSIAVPVEYVSLGRRDEGDDRDVRASNNFFLKTVWEQGVDDAWGSRKMNQLTPKLAVHRVPDPEDGWPTARDAFRRGADAHKKCAEVLTDSGKVCNATLDRPRDVSMVEFLESEAAARKVDELGQRGVQIEGGGQDSVSTDMGADQFQAVAKVLALDDGFRTAWEAAQEEGKEPEKPESRYPYTLEELRKAFDDGATARARDEKRKNVVVAEEEKEEEEGCCMMIVETLCFPCIAFHESCLPMCVKEETEGGGQRTICCGATYGDWLVILICFACWYTFLGMWYWALIEVLMTVAEPQRPW
eukprot:TRINITY_DN1675_c0_g1_i2.p1 TRINITY_DN1675_c0_g1~~TRINITY_DN1675_c0_g1_i2.p1  ORF type:complete len:935 (+),score=407.90 TRINITY_DN1675_c0_g1_i2:96-2807(+)